MNWTLRRAALPMVIPFAAIATVGIIGLVLVSNFVDVEGASEAEMQAYLLQFGLLILSFAFGGATLGGAIVSLVMANEFRMLGTTPTRKILSRAVFRGRTETLTVDDKALALRLAQLMTRSLPMLLAVSLTIIASSWLGLANAYLTTGLSEIPAFAGIRSLSLGIMIAASILMLIVAAVCARQTRIARAFVRDNTAATV